MFDKFSTGNFYFREQGAGIREHTGRNKIKSHSLVKKMGRVGVKQYLIH
jgi:hypothetical protein